MADDTCPYRCCRRRRRPGSPCYCDACCVGFEEKLREREELWGPCRDEGQGCDRLRAALRGLIADHLRRREPEQAELTCRQLREIGISSAGAAGPPGAQAALAVYRSGDGLMAFYPRRLDVFRVPAGTVGLLEDGEGLRRPEETPTPGGVLRFFAVKDLAAAGGGLLKPREGARPMSLEPIRRFSLRLPLRAPERPSVAATGVSLCTDRRLGAAQPWGDFGDFCGIIDFSGKVLFELPREPWEAGAVPEALAMAGDGREALWAISRPAASSRSGVGDAWTVERYLVWRRGEGLRRLEPHAPEARELLGRYGLDIYLPEP